MEQYIAFLRGINISGKNKIAMPELKRVFEEIGFLEVRTYINSGNVIFSSAVQDQSELIRKCEAAIKAGFGLDIPVAVVSVKALEESLDHAPAWWDEDKEAINYAIFLISPTTVEEVFAGAGEIKPEYEKADHYKDVIFWATPRKTFPKAKWSKIASSPVNNKVTIRTANTVKKLLLLAGK